MHLFRLKNINNFSYLFWLRIIIRPFRVYLESLRSSLVKPSILVFDSETNETKKGFRWYPRRSRLFAAFVSFKILSTDW